MTEETALVARTWEHVSPAEVIERVVIGGDLAALSPDQRVAYYAQVCNSLGLNPFTRPFDYLRLNNKLVLYAKKDATDQIRRNLNVSVTGVEPAPVIEGLYGLIAHVRTPDGRADTGTAYVSVKGLAGDALANALMKCETKAKRRATLSLAGLGIIDESEVETIPDGEPVVVDDAGRIAPTATVSDVIAARVAAIEQAETAETPDEDPRSSSLAGEELTETDGEIVADEPSGQPEPVAETADPLADLVETAERDGGHAVRSMDLMAFANFVASVGAVVDRDEVRQIAGQMFPDATGFRMLSDEQRGAIADEIDRRVAERARDDDAEDEEDEPTPITDTVEDQRENATCGEPSPYGDGALCDRDAGHDGPHGSGNNETW